MKRAISFLSRTQGIIVRCILTFVIVLFIGILVAAYFIASEANPILLDEDGKPINAEASRSE
jgi:hypothetical protein